MKIKNHTFNYSINQSNTKKTETEFKTVMQYTACTFNELRFSYTMYKKFNLSCNYSINRFVLRLRVHKKHAVCYLQFSMTYTIN